MINKQTILPVLLVLSTEIIDASVKLPSLNLNRDQARKNRFSRTSPLELPGIVSPRTNIYQPDDFQANLIAGKSNLKDKEDEHQIFSPRDHISMSNARVKLTPINTNEHQNTPAMPSPRRRCKSSGNAGKDTDEIDLIIDVDGSDSQASTTNETPFTPLSGIIEATISRNATPAPITILTPIARKKSSVQTLRTIVSLNTSA